MFDTSSSPDINLGNKDSLSSSRYVFSEMLDETCLYNAVTTSSNVDLTPYNITTEEFLSFISITPNME